MIHFQGSELLNQFASLLKRGRSKMKDPCSEVAWCARMQAESNHSYLPCKKKKILPGVYSSLNFDDKTCNDFYSSIWEHNAKDWPKKR